MKRPLWFRAKKYGWGWTPDTWQGWSLVSIYLAIVVFLFLQFDYNSVSVVETAINIFPVVLILSLALIFISYLTGEKPHWQWGDKKRKKKR